MRIILTCLASIIVPLLTLGQAAPADAATRHGMRLPAHRYANETGQRGYSNPMAANGYTGYYERVLDKVPYGSQLWWRVYNSIPRN
jgi:hypothetical protein